MSLRSIAAPLPAVTVTGTVAVTGAQQGATAVGGYTVPDTSTTVLPGTYPATIPAVAGKSLTLRTVTVAGYASGSNVGLVAGRIVLTDSTTGRTLGTIPYSCNLVTSGVAVAFTPPTQDLLGIAAGVGNGITVSLATDARPLGASTSTTTTINTKAV